MKGVSDGRVGQEDRGEGIPTIEAAGAGGAAESRYEPQSGTRAEAGALASIDGVYVGWRTWALQDGALVSPLTGFVWPCGVAVQASLSWRVRFFQIGVLAIPITLLAGAVWSFGGGDREGFHRLVSMLGFGASVGVLTVLVPLAVFILTPFYGRLRLGYHANRDQDASWFRMSGDHVVFGKVALWGNVVEHVKGARGEYAYPLEITHYAAPGQRMPVSIADAPDWVRPVVARYVP